MEPVAASRRRGDWRRSLAARKFPLPVDGERNIVETSIIIESLQLAHSGPVRLLARPSVPPRTSE